MEFNFVCVCARVCVCERKREREREGGEREISKTAAKLDSLIHNNSQVEVTNPF